MLNLIEFVETLECSKNSEVNYRFNDETVDFLIATTKKQIPQPIDIAVFEKDKIAGYCPTCNGTVMIQLSRLRKFKGACCSWCGQKLLLPEEEEK